MFYKWTSFMDFLKNSHRNMRLLFTPKCYKWFKWHKMLVGRLDVSTIHQRSGFCDLSHFHKCSSIPILHSYNPAQSCHLCSFSIDPVAFKSIKQLPVTYVNLDASTPNARWLYPSSIEHGSIWFCASYHKFTWLTQMIQCKDE